MIKKLNIDFKISGTKITIPFEAICTVTDKKFTGFVISEYHPINEVLEYVDLERYIQDITKEKLTAEELANHIFIEITKTIQPKYLKVIVDVKNSEAHQPVEVWIESDKE
ncbi:MAG: hypothetical protein ABIB04_01615 [Patescibacteria group bacterium]